MRIIADFILLLIGRERRDEIVDDQSFQGSGNLHLLFKLIFFF